MSWTHTHTAKLEATPERAFRALTEPSELTQWFAERVDVSLRPGGAYRFWGKHTLGCPTEKEADQAVVKVESPRELSFSWTIHKTPTQVSLTLEPAEEGTTLTVRHTVDGDFGIRRGRELIEDLWHLNGGNLRYHLKGGSGVVLFDYTDPRPEVRQQVLIEAPTQTVWRALTEPAAIKQWFGTKQVTVDPRVGGEYNLHWKYPVAGKDVEAGTGKILEFEPNKKLVLTWLDWRGDKSVDRQTISFTLEPVGKQTRLTFVHAGFERTVDVGDFPFGWTWFLAELSRVSKQLAG